VGALTRRHFLIATSALAACSRKDRGPDVASAPSPGAAKSAPIPASAPIATSPRAAASAPGIDAALPRGETRLLTWSFEQRGPTGEAVIVVPAWGSDADRYPVLVALHGRGEAVKSPSEGAMGWPRDYALTRAIARVCAPPLNEQDLEGFVDPSRLAATNRQLEEKPFGGLVVVCPYLPDINLRSSADVADYGRYLRSVVLPRVRKEAPALASAEATGIDGVSLGGAVAMRVGLTNAEAFGAVGALQPAISEDQMTEWTELARAALAKRRALKLRLTTSTDDYFRRPITMLDDAWRAANVPHDFAELPGPHDYPFNRGPGSIEMILWHDRVLARA
jgi:enterochelin esterase-like enzyme